MPSCCNDETPKSTVVQVNQFSYVKREIYEKNLIRKKKTIRKNLKYLHTMLN